MQIIEIKLGKDHIAVNSLLYIMQLSWLSIAIMINNINFLYIS